MDGGDPSAIGARPDDHLPLIAWPNRVLWTGIAAGRTAALVSGPEAGGWARTGAFSNKASVAAKIGFVAVPPGSVRYGLFRLSSPNLVVASKRWRAISRPRSRGRPSEAAISAPS